MVCWRKVLKRQWDDILGVLNPELLTDASLYFLPQEISRTLQNPRDQSGETRVEHSKMLLEYLLRCDQSWPDAFIDGLRQSDQAPLANTLEKDYTLVVQMEKDRRDRFEKRGLAPRVQKMKHTEVSLFNIK